MTNTTDPMMDMFIFETIQLTNQLEQIIIAEEKKGKLNTSSINEIFRIMHTIKGSASMMSFGNISEVAHSVEDIFYFVRENHFKISDYTFINNIVLKSIDYIKNETMKLESGLVPDTDASELIKLIKNYLLQLKGFNRFRAVLLFEDNCEMENIRAYAVVRNLSEISSDLIHKPQNILEDDKSIEIIRKEGFEIFFNSDKDYEQIKNLIEETIFLKEYELEIVDMNFSECSSATEIECENNKIKEINEKKSESLPLKNNYISVNVSKLDKLMDSVGELVISEAMVTQNPKIKDLQIEGFDKSVQQLRKIISELHDIVMSVRMVPLSSTFQNMNRIVRDMNKKLNKNVQLHIIGEETEVDKNIIEHISDPIMHLIRNAMDHGTETSNERIKAGKPEHGNVTLEAKNSGGDVWIIVKDDGRGLDRDKILLKARKLGLITKPEGELTDRDIYSFILLPGFSTKEDISEYSGRGVGMDIVARNIEKVGGNVLVESEPGKGTAISIKIPLTLAIIDGILVRTGNSSYIIPTICIIESFRMKEDDIIKDIDDNEMVLIRNQCIPLVRLKNIFSSKSSIDSIEDGIVIMVDQDGQNICIFVDALIGQQQVIVKTLPAYIKKVRGIAGCTLLGDGNISLILDIAELISLSKQ